VLVHRAGFSQKRAAEKALMFTAIDLEATS